jgi:hypothetical protein
MFYKIFLIAFMKLEENSLLLFFGCVYTELKETFSTHLKEIFWGN